MLLEQFSSSWVAVCKAFSDLFNHWNRFKLMTTGHYIVKLQLAQYEQHMTQGAKINATLHLIFHGTQWGRTHFKCCKLLKGNKFSAVVTIRRFFPAVLQFGEWVPPHCCPTAGWCKKKALCVLTLPRQDAASLIRGLLPVLSSAWYDDDWSRACSLYWWQQVSTEPQCVCRCPKGLPACWNKAFCRATKSNRWTNEQ